MHPWIHASMDSSLPAACVEVFIYHEEAGRSPHQDGEENLSLNVRQCNASKLANGKGVSLFWNEYTNGLLPLCWHLLIPLSHFHKPPQHLHHLGVVLVGKPIRPRGQC